MNLRDLKLFLHLAESCHFGRTARTMHVSPSTLSRQIQRLEEDLGHTLFLRDNRTVGLTDAGEQLRQFAQQTLLQYQQLRHVMDLNTPSLNGELRLFCSVTASYNNLPPLLDRFYTDYPQVEIKLTTGNVADAIKIVQYGAADLAITVRPELLRPSIIFTPLGLIPLVLIAPALPCPVRSQAIQKSPNWDQIPFIMPEQGPARRSIDLWFRRYRISNPLIYSTVSSGHEAIVSMVALGCGIAMLPDVVLENSPESMRNRVLKLENVESATPLELGVCVQKKRLSEPLIHAFWHLLL
ncbi:HTH-type transcriptional activator IlvY [Pantoea sp. Nvir]|uniref:HTH-type transcriptional activator IlvY n=1 Tax=Pantoea sp. Nvir TaxID=2576760 RepID=UPI00135A7B63|nr:HTH-type transcriptional activator IlvY [Pantoea sp. Nvir]MXP66806.1 HTH-type transcriptional activator IlvY [Pantoea sp. Nvir]CAJ0993637.1 HTH-type transcriptional regulator HdfR [Pantoea sp. Nvir]